MSEARKLSIMDRVRKIIGTEKDEIDIYKNLNKDQKLQVNLAKEAGLTPEQIAVWAKPEFSWEQMEEIRWGQENGLTPEQIAIYAKPEFDWQQIQQIRFGQQAGLTEEQIAVYANSQFDSFQMSQIRTGQQNGLTIEQVTVYAEPEFDMWQMREIRNGQEYGLTPEQIAIYAKPEFTWEQMRQISIAQEKGLTPEQIAVWAKPELKSDKMEEIYEAQLNGITIDNYPNPKHSWIQAVEKNFQLEFGADTTKVDSISTMSSMLNETRTLRESSNLPSRDNYEIETKILKMVNGNPNHFKPNKNGYLFDFSQGKSLRKSVMEKAPIRPGTSKKVKRADKKNFFNSTRAKAIDEIRLDNREKDLQAMQACNDRGINIKGITFEEDFLGRMVAKDEPYYLEKPDFVGKYMQDILLEKEISLAPEKFSEDYFEKHSLSSGIAEEEAEFNAILNSAEVEHQKEEEEKPSIAELIKKAEKEAEHSEKTKVDHRNRERDQPDRIDKER